MRARSVALNIASAARRALEDDSFSQSFALTPKQLTIGCQVSEAELTIHHVVSSVNVANDFHLDGMTVSFELFNGEKCLFNVYR